MYVELEEVCTWIPAIKWVSWEQEPLGICVLGKISKNIGGKHIIDSNPGETRIPSDMCLGKHASLGICMRETRYLGKHISL